MMIRMHYFWLFGLLLPMLQYSSAAAYEPVVTDSRIKIMVYNEYDVYQVVTHYGYQSNVEFSKKERIITISLGDRVGWQVVPSGRRLFIRALEEGARTNMTVVTNKRSYQFDLRSNKGGALRPSEELIYVMRFYYPDEDKSISLPAVKVRDVVAVAPPVVESKVVASSTKAIRNMNYHYTYTGDDRFAPLKVFDNGQATFFKLPKKNVEPKFSVISKKGREVPIVVAKVKNGFLMAGTVARQYVIRYGDRYINVYRER